MRTKLSLVIISFMLLALPLAAAAADTATTSASDVQSQINALTAEVQQLLSQLGQSVGSGGGTGAPFQPVPGLNVACPILTVTLLEGMNNPQVASLQQFLISQGDLSQGLSTGYFGKLTLQAVQKWQSAHGIVSSGSPSTTGYGLVGPATRAAIVKVCENAPGSGKPLLSAKPSSGSVPLAVTLAGSVKGQSYTLNFGDGSTPVTGSCSDSCSSFGFYVHHTFASADTYDVTLTDGSGATADAKINATGTGGSGILTASPSSGAAPLNVTFIAEDTGAQGTLMVDFGDGSTCTLGSTDCNWTHAVESAHSVFTHTYTSAGTYLVTLETSALPAQVQGTDCSLYPTYCETILGYTNSGVQTTIATTSVTVTGGSGGNVSFTASPASGAAPLAVTFAPSSSSAYYDVNFGDGNSASLQQGSVTHTYDAAGSYTATFTSDAPCLHAAQACKIAQTSYGTAAITVSGGSGTKTFSTPGTFSFTVPSGVTSVNAVVVGGGGGGGAGSGGWGSGGGGGCGGAVVGRTVSVTPGQQVSVTVGKGGSGGNGSVNPASGGIQSGPSNPASNGSSGGDSSFGSVTAAGGGWGRTGYLNLYDQHAGGSGGGSGGGGGGNGWSGSFAAQPGNGGTAGSQTDSKGAGGYCTGSGWNVNLAPLVTQVPYKAGAGGAVPGGNNYSGGGGGGLIIDGSTVGGGAGVGSNDNGGEGYGAGGGGAGVDYQGNGGAGANGVVYLEWNE